MAGDYVRVDAEWRRAQHVGGLEVEHTAVTRARRRAACVGTARAALRCEKAELWREPKPDGLEAFYRTLTGQI
eukprot:6182890-Pleurochrysis_carterae.AAC.9